jgi:glycosyltransferase involved in cell wall biosynthesis
VNVTVVIPSISIRASMLARALTSVAAQGRPADAIAVAVDHDHAGAVVTRNRALAMDDDDELHPNHLHELLKAAEDSGADLIYPNFRCVDPSGHEMRLPKRLSSGQPFDDRLLRHHSYIPVTALARTKLVNQVGGFSYPKKSRYEDWGLWLKMLDAGGRIHHHPVLNWTWHHHGANTSGLGDRW